MQTKRKKEKKKKKTKKRKQFPEGDEAGEKGNIIASTHPMIVLYPDRKARAVPEKKVISK